MYSYRSFRNTVFLTEYVSSLTDYGLKLQKGDIFIILTVMDIHFRRLLIMEFL